ncbi:MAG: DUF3015 family protein [Acidobacteriota bacterium]
MSHPPSLLVFPATQQLIGWIPAGSAHHQPRTFDRSRAHSTTLSARRGQVIQNFPPILRRAGRACLYQNDFITINQENILTDISRGGGEYLESLSELLELSKVHKSQFNANMRNSVEYLGNQDASRFVDYVFELESQAKYDSGSHIRK